LHELAHVRRFDFASQTLAEAACALYWFNPIVWFCARTMREDAELAADEAALQTGIRPSEYASELLQIAAALGKRRPPFAHIGTHAMTQSKLSLRLQSVLSPAAGHRGLTTVQALAAVAVTVIVVPALANLRVTGQRDVPADQEKERVEALHRMKEVALATVMYAQDYDGVFPYAQQTATVAAITYPYAKSADCYQSPTQGGHFLFNLKLGGVDLTAIHTPMTVPMWYETLPKSNPNFCVGYVDGHAMRQSASSGPEFMTQLKRTFPRHPAIKPLPVSYIPKMQPRSGVTLTPPRLGSTG
jgi:hypothetical protein